MKRRLFVLCIMLAVLAILGIGTLAYYSVERTVENVVTAGSVSLKVHEDTAPGKAFPLDGMQVTPGEKVSDVVTVENTGDHSLYVRVKLVKGVENSTLSAEECMDLNINDTDWTYKDGYYYYNHALPGGETTAQMFSQVTLTNAATGSQYRGKVFTVNVSAYGVQSENNGDNVWDALGWPED